MLQPYLHDQISIAIDERWLRSTALLGDPFLLENSSLCSTIIWRQSEYGHTRSLNLSYPEVREEFRRLGFSQMHETETETFNLAANVMFGFVMLLLNASREGASPLFPVADSIPYHQPLLAVNRRALPKPGQLQIL